MNTNVPSLGMAWKNMVSTRLQIRRTNGNRMFTVIFSPYIPQHSIPFELTSQGIFVTV